MIVRVDIEIPADQEQTLISDAYSFGWMREEPRKRWTEQEKKEAIKEAIKGIVQSHIENKINPPWIY